MLSWTVCIVLFIIIMMIGAVFYYYSNTVPPPLEPFQNTYDDNIGEEIKAWYKQMTDLQSMLQDLNVSFDYYTKASTFYPGGAPVDDKYTEIKGALDSKGDTNNSDLKGVNGLLSSVTTIKQAMKVVQPSGKTLNELIVLVNEINEGKSAALTTYTTVMSDLSSNYVQSMESIRAEYSRVESGYQTTYTLCVDAANASYGTAISVANDTYTAAMQTLFATSKTYSQDRAGNKYKGNNLEYFSVDLTSDVDPLKQCQNRCNSNPYCKGFETMFEDPSVPSPGCFIKSRMAVSGQQSAKDVQYGNANYIVSFVNTDQDSAFAVKTQMYEDALNTQKANIEGCKPADTATDDFKRKREEKQQIYDDSVLAINEQFDASMSYYNSLVSDNDYRTLQGLLEKIKDIVNAVYNTEDKSGPLIDTIRPFVIANLSMPSDKIREIVAYMSDTDNVTSPLGIPPVPPEDILTNFIDKFKPPVAETATYEHVSKAEDSAALAEVNDIFNGKATKIALDSEGRDYKRLTGAIFPNSVNFGTPETITPYQAAQRCNNIDTCIGFEYNIGDGTAYYVSDWVDGTTYKDNNIDSYTSGEFPSLAIEQSPPLFTPTDTTTVPNSYVGCYTAIAQNGVQLLTNLDPGNTHTVESCQELAKGEEYGFFGIQQYNSANGTGVCVAGHNEEAQSSGFSARCQQDDTGDIYGKYSRTNALYTV